MGDIDLWCCCVCAHLLYRCCQADHSQIAHAVGVLCGGTGLPNGEPIGSFLGKNDVWYPIQVSSGRCTLHRSMAQHHLLGMLRAC